jgi:hypothetical protein
MEEYLHCEPSDRDTFIPSILRIQPQEVTD